MLMKIFVALVAVQMASAIYLAGGGGVGGGGGVPFAYPGYTSYGPGYGYGGFGGGIRESISANVAAGANVGGGFGYPGLAYTGGGGGYASGAIGAQSLFQNAEKAQQNQKQ